MINDNKNYFAIMDQEDNTIKAAYETETAAINHMTASNKKSLRLIEVTLDMLLRCYATYLDTIRRYHG